MNIDNRIIEEYSDYGVVVIRNIITPYWLKKLTIGIEKNFKKPSKYKCVYEKKGEKEIFLDDYCNWLRIQAYKDFIFHSNIARIA